MAGEDQFNEAPESELLLQIANGSSDAFKQIYLKYFDTLLKQTVQLTKDKAVALDIIQDIFYKLWDRRSQFRQYEKIGGWLFVCAYNASINYLKQLPKSIQAADVLNNLHAVEDEAAMAHIEAQYQLIDAAIDTLPPQRRRVFLLCKYEGLTYEQAAERLSISKNTVKEHISKASESIKNFISKEAEGTLLITTLACLESFL